MFAAVVFIIASLGLICLLFSSLERREKKRRAVQEELFSKATKEMRREKLLNLQRDYPCALDYYCGQITSGRMRKFDVTALSDDEVEALYGCRHLFSAREGKLNPGRRSPHKY